MTGADPYLPGHGDDRYGVEHYALDLRYKPLGNHLEGRAELSVRALVDLCDLVVDLHRLEVRSLRVEGAAVARWTHRGSRLRIRLAKTVAAGEPIEPPEAEGREQDSLSGNPRREHVVERAHTVARDHEQPLAAGRLLRRVEVADFARVHMAPAGERVLGFGHPPIIPERSASSREVYSPHGLINPE